MASPSLDQLARQRGVVSVAKRLLRSVRLDAEAEAFLVASFEKLPAELLLAWLSFDAPAGTEGVRPGGAVARRIAEEMGREPFLLLLLGALERIADANVRDDLVAAFSSSGGQFEHALLRHAEGGRIFNAVRDCERSYAEPIQQRTRQPELLGLQNGESVPSLLPSLYPDRRNDTACIRTLRGGLTSPHRFYILGVLRDAGIASEVGSLSDLLGTIPTLGETDFERWPEIAFLLAIAKNWNDVDQCRDFYVRRAIRLAGQGSPWAHLYWETDPAFRDDVALASLRSGQPAPWALSAVSRRLSGLAAWDAGFALVAGPFDPAAVPQLVGFAASAEHALGTRTTNDDVEDAVREFCLTERDRLLLLASLGLPDEPDDAFDARFVDVFAPLGAQFLLDRLLQLPLTKQRACRILDLTRRAGTLWDLDRIDEIAALVGTISDPVPLPPKPTLLGAYRTLVGPAADVKLVGLLDGALARGDLGRALDVAGLAPELVSDGQREGLRKLALALPLSSLATLQADAPWLLSPEDVVAQAASDDKAWGFVESLPGYLGPVIEARAVSAEDRGLAEKLLDRLEGVGKSRRAVLGLACERLRSLGPNAVGAHWLGAKLKSKSLWEESGTDVAHALLGPRDIVGASALVEVCTTSIRSNETDLRPIVHTVLARVLVRIVRGAFGQGDAHTAERALSALAHLSPGQRIRGSIHGLLEQKPNEACTQLIELNEALLRRGGDVATLDAVRDALVDLVGRDGIGAEP